MTFCPPCIKPNEDPHLRKRKLLEFKARLQAAVTNALHQKQEFERERKEKEKLIEELNKKHCMLLEWL